MKDIKPYISEEGQLLSLPEPTKEGIIAFLGGSLTKGVGPAYAKRIVERFGPEIFNPDFDFSKQLKEVDGLGDKTILDFIGSLSTLKTDPKTIALLYSAGLKDIEVEKIISRYKNNVEKIIRYDPYEMVENVWKFSFFSADKIGRFLGISPDDPRRLRGALLTAVKFYAERGSLFATESEAVRTAAKLTGTDEERIRPEIENLINEGRIIKSLGGLYLPVYYKAEEEAAEKLKSIVVANNTIEELTDFENEIPKYDISGHPLSTDQKKAIETVLNNKVTIITGGPGTGKTTTVNGIIRMLMDMDKKVVLTAPTGRAAKRMSELTGKEAKTIHRLLGYSMGRGYKNKKFEADILIIDEASMLEQVLFNHLLQAVGSSTRIVLVGDTNQLPAIGAGNVLQDMIESGSIPVINLKENFRQEEGSGIAGNASLIKEGLMPDPLPGNDFIFVEEKDKKKIIDRLISLLTKEIPSYMGLQPNQLQIVTPQKEGELGSDELNKIIQRVVNPDSPELKKGIKCFRLGDRVMQTSNSSIRGVYNGETGRVIKIDDEDKTLTVDFGNEKILKYGLSDLKELSLAYATTVHKLQGTETDYMILLLTSDHRQLLYRNLLYTGISRAKKLCVILGEGRALETAVRTSDKNQRKSNFKTRLSNKI